MSRRGQIWIGAAVGVAVVVGALGAVAFSYFGGSAPAEVSLSASAPAASKATTTGSFDGTWTIDTSSGSFSDFSSTFAGYRVEEQLGTIGANTAVGRTPNVSGSLDISGTTITQASITVDMTTLQSDDDRRDNSIRTRGLETATYPTAMFELTESIDIGHVPTTGEVIEVAAVGSLTLHGVTNQVTIPMQATWTGSRLEVVGSFDVALADFAIDPPTGFLVLSIADTGTVELHLLFEPS
jgi:polyisoprenoid-binding protein YceI